MKRYKPAIVYSFMIGLVIGTLLPSIKKYEESFRFQKLIQKQKKIQFETREKICKEDNSEYKKFLNLGFPKTAIEKFNICMQEQWKNIKI